MRSERGHVAHSGDVGLTRDGKNAGGQEVRVQNKNHEQAELVRNLMQL
jgi:hypothetical protein